MVLRNGMLHLISGLSSPTSCPSPPLIFLIYHSRLSSLHPFHIFLPLSKHLLHMCRYVTDPDGIEVFTTTEGPGAEPPPIAAFGRKVTKAKGKDKKGNEKWIYSDAVRCPSDQRDIVSH